MAASAKKSSGSDSAIGAIGGMIPGIGGQLAKVSQMASDPKGAMKNFGKKVVEKALKEAGKKFLKKLAQKAVMSPYFWIGVAIVLGILTWIAFFLVIVSAVVGKDNSTNQNQTYTASNGVTPVSIDEAKQYVVIVDNPAPYSSSSTPARDGETLNEAQKKFIYTTFALPLGSAGYKKLLSNSDGSPRPLYVYFYKPLDTPGAGATGGANYGGGDTMRFWGFFEYKDARAGAVDAGLGHMLIHESGHIIDRRSGSGALSMPLTSLNKSDGANCYDTTNSRSGLNYIKSYAFRGTDGDNGGPLAESFAEALANNVYCAPGKDCFYAGHIYNSTNIPDYPNACSNTYSWIKQNVFGGDDFFAPQSTSGTNSNMCSDYYTAADTKNSNAITKVNSNNPTPKNIYLHKGDNFGDPQCELANKTLPEKEDIIASAIEQLDPKNAAAWEYIALNESGSDNPLAYNANSHSTLGAYGLFQMNPLINPYTGQEPTSGFDRHYVGDGTWRESLQNAIDYGNYYHSLALWSTGAGFIWR